MNRREQPDPDLHRNNAAEWVMWAALRPIAWVVRLLDRLRPTRKG